MIRSNQTALLRTPMPAPSATNDPRKDTFRLPIAAQYASRIEMNTIDLSMIISGIDLTSVKLPKCRRNLLKLHH
jgi:hypothetical protein